MKITITMECEVYGRPTLKQLQEEMCDQVPWMVSAGKGNGNWDVCVNRMIVECDELGKVKVGP